MIITLSNGMKLNRTFNANACTGYVARSIEFTALDIRRMWTMSVRDPDLFRLIMGQLENRYESRRRGQGLWHWREHTTIDGDPSFALYGPNGCYDSSYADKSVVIALVNKKNVSIEAGVDRPQYPKDWATRNEILAEAGVGYLDAGVPTDNPGVEDFHPHPPPSRPPPLDRDHQKGGGGWDWGLVFLITLALCALVGTYYADHQFAEWVRAWTR